MMPDNLAEIGRRRGWLRQADCDIEEFARQQSRITEPADYPLAMEIAGNVPIYDGDAIRRSAGDPEARPALLAEWRSYAMTFGTGHRRLSRSLCRPCGDRRGNHPASTRSSPPSARPVASPPTIFAKPGANDRGLERAGEALPARPGPVRRLLRQRGRSRWSARPGSGPPTRSRRRSTASIPAGARAIGAFATTILASQSPAVIERYPAHVHRPVAVPDPAGRGGALRHAAGERTDAIPALFAELRAGLSRGPGGPSSGPISRRTTSSCRSARGDAVFFNPCPVPCRRPQPLPGHPAHGQPAAGLVCLRARDGGRSTAPA